MQIKQTNCIESHTIHLMIFGNSGVGKTYLAKTLEGKTIIINLEDGLLSLKDSQIDYVNVEGFNVNEKLASLRTILSTLAKSDYENIFIDSLTEVSQLFVESAKLEYPDDKQIMKVYGRHLESMTKFIKYCRDLNKNVFMTCLMKTDKDEIGRRFNVPDLAGSISSKIGAYLDFMFCYRTFEKDGVIHRVLQTKNNETYIAKDRSGKLDEYESPNLQNIINKVFNKGSKNV